MTTPKAGDTVKVHYTGKLVDGEVFDSSVGQDPLEFTIGEGQLIPGFENKVMTMTSGETATVTIPAEEAYGPRLEELLQKIERSNLPDDMDFQVGMQLEAPQDEEHSIILTVTEVTDKMVTLDANHPLAGQDLIFEIQLLDVAPGA